jgi:hypothetical protein
MPVKDEEGKEPIQPTPHTVVPLPVPATGSQRRPRVASASASASAPAPAPAPSTARAPTSPDHHHHQKKQQQSPQQRPRAATAAGPTTAAATATIVGVRGLCLGVHSGDPGEFDTTPLTATKMNRAAKPRGAPGALLGVRRDAQVCVYVGGGGLGGRVWCGVWSMWGDWGEFRDVCI